MIKSIILFLQEKPVVGIASGAGGWLISFTEISTKVIGAVSGILGIAVAILTLVSKIIEIRNNLKTNKKA